MTELVKIAHGLDAAAERPDKIRIPTCSVVKRCGEFGGKRSGHARQITSHLARPVGHPVALCMLRVENKLGVAIHRLGSIIDPKSAITGDRDDQMPAMTQMSKNRIIQEHFAQILEQYSPTRLRA